MQDFREPMVPKVKWTATRTGEVVYGCPAEYVIDRLQPDGKVRRLVHVREPMMDDPEVSEAFVESSVKSMNWSNPTTGWSWKGPNPPQQKPYYHKMIPGRDGRLWIWPGYPLIPTQNPGIFNTRWLDPRTGSFDVFDQEGVFLGVAPLPEGVTYLAFSGINEPFVAGDTIWVVRRDSLDVKYIDRMLIEWGGE
jgi:hypothetical protein